VSRERAADPRRDVGAMRHLSEDRLIELALAVARAGTEPGADPAEPHLQRCDRCSRRLRELSSFVADVFRSADGAYEQTFPAERLAAQRERVLRRLERTVNRHAARVLPFPLAAGSRAPSPVRARRWRWLPAAAVAGLVVGITIGQALRVPWFLGETTTPRRSAYDPLLEVAEAELLAPYAPNVLGDEEFLAELDRALSAPQVSELAAIDAITPQVREVVVNIR